jgi:hypothetical protein
VSGFRVASHVGFIDEEKEKRIAKKGEEKLPGKWKKSRVL